MEACNIHLAKMLDTHGKMKHMTKMFNTHGKM